MKPPPGQRRGTFNLPEDDWQAMKQAMVDADLPHANWLRAAVREKLARVEGDDY